MSDRLMLDNLPGNLRERAAPAGTEPKSPGPPATSDTVHAPDASGGSPTETFLSYRDDTGRQQVVNLASAARLTVGRGPSSDIRLERDYMVSRLHGLFERIGSDWILADGGLSRNGTFVNGERLVGRRRLDDGDVILVGSTSMTYRDNTSGRSAVRSVVETQATDDVITLGSLSSTQLQVLKALCRPYQDRSQYATPATNRQIADELFFSVEAVKTHLRALFRKFGVEELPQNQKRAKLVELAFQAGLVSERGQ